MEIERIFYPVRTLGPGMRLGIWTVGCAFRCFNCCNEELQEANPDKEIPLSTLFDMIDSIEHPIDGVTISGGDPFFQVEELVPLVKGLVDRGIEDILIYTGNTLKQLREMNNMHVNFVLDNIAVLIDGIYIEALNDNSPLRGSFNQQVHIFKEKYREKYEAFLKGERQLQTLVYDQSLLAIGIPPKGYKKDLHEKAKEKGIAFREY